MRRRTLVFAAVLAALAAVPAIAASHGSVNVLRAFSKQLPVVRKNTSVPVLLPPSLPFAHKLPKLYLTGYASRNDWGLVITGAPNCGGADACFLASFEGKRGGKLPRKPNLRLAGGQPAVYKGVTCGGSCSPATLWFTNRGVLYTWQHSDPPANGRTVLARLAARATAAGPR